MACSSDNEAVHVRTSFSERQSFAATSGWSTDMVVGEAPKDYLSNDLDSPDHWFTPDVIESLDRSAAQADPGMVQTFDQYEAQFQLKREAWLKEHVNS